MRAARPLAVLEALAAGLAGAALGGLAGTLAFGVLALPGAAIGGLNGLASGALGIYDWRSPRGWLAFATDSTWALLGTSVGLTLHAVNALYPGAAYCPALSRRRNRHVYLSGARLKPALALTLGNVISNGAEGRGEPNVSFLENHEALHVWQGRLFGPLFQATYAVWFPLGALVGLVVWCFDRREPLRRLVETVAYFDNPFEYWAYRNDRYWPPREAHPKVAWGRAKGGIAAKEDPTRGAAP
jgi:hypothetical protein